MSGHLIALEAMQNYVQTATTYVTYSLNHQDLVSIYFLI